VPDANPPAIRLAGRAADWVRGFRGLTIMFSDALSVDIGAGEVSGESVNVGALYETERR
jgi:hypothetical protein